MPRWLVPALALSLMLVACGEVDDLGARCGDAEEAPAPTSGPARDDEDGLAGSLGVVSLDVGQGDATLARSKETELLVDTGRHDRGGLADRLDVRGVEDLEVLAVTHPHADHLGQFPEVVNAVDVEEVVERLDAGGVELYGTGAHGTVTATHDGNRWMVDVDQDDELDAHDANAQDRDEGDPSEPGCVDLNTATVEELEAIQHIGPQRGAPIVDQRPWSSVGDLEEVDGIGAAASPTSTNKALPVSPSQDDVPAVVDRIEHDASGRELAVLLVGDGEHEHVVPAEQAGGLAEEGARVRVDLDDEANVVTVRDDPGARADAERRRAQRNKRRQAIAERRPSKRRRG